MTGEATLRREQGLRGSIDILKYKAQKLAEEYATLKEKFQGSGLNCRQRWRSTLSAQGKRNSLQNTNRTMTASMAKKGRERMSNDKIDLADFNELLSLQTAPTVQADPAELTPAPTPKELAQQKAIMKVYRKYQQREYERIEHPTQFPSDYFFSALAELILDE